MKYNRYLVFEIEHYGLHYPFSGLDSFSTITSAIEFALSSEYDLVEIFDCNERITIDKKLFCSKCYKKRPFDNIVLTSNPPMQRATCGCGNIDIY